MYVVTVEIYQTEQMEPPFNGLQVNGGGVDREFTKSLVFCDFANFSVVPEGLYPRNCSFQIVRESLYPRNFLKFLKN